MSWKNEYGNAVSHLMALSGRSSRPMILLCLLLSLGLIQGYKDGLYSTEDDDVLPLNNESFQNKVIHSKPGVIWVVEFYNSWCGHCIHFAPTWKKLASNLKEWRDIVVIAGIDCSQTVNLETCRTFDISAYPTIKMFPPMDSPNRLTTLESIKTQEFHEIKEILLNFMTHHAPDSWPNLQSLEEIEDIWRDKEASHEHVLLLFEEEKSAVGRQVILDLRNTPNVLIRRMLENNVAKYGINRFPSLYKVNPDSTYTMLAVGNKMPADDRTLFVNLVKALTRGEEDKMTLDEKGERSRSGQDEGKQQHGSREGEVLLFKPKYNSSVVSMQDLESALHYSFRQEVAICKTIDGDKMTDLKAFVTVLMKYFPGRKPIQNFLSKVHEMLGSLKTNNITGEEWMDRIDRAQDKDSFLPEVIRWEACQGSSPRYRGYPCSMWTLFHTLTVAAYHQNTGRGASNPQEVLVAIRGYMEHFFGCEECSKNFQAMAKSVEADVKEHKDSVLWLWSAHNKANKRLNGDVSEDPKHPKIQFPSEKMCPKCQTLIKSDDGMKFSWDTDKVLEFLLNFYSENSISYSEALQNAEEVFNNIEMGGSEVTAAKQKELDWWEKKQREQDLKQVMRLREKKREKMKGKYDLQKRDLDDKGSVQSDSEKFVRNQSAGLWGLTQLDFSMCVVFYLVSTVIILMLYHHFIVKRRMMPCKTIKHLPL